jgi:hypothetical protein
MEPACFPGSRPAGKAHLWYYAILAQRFVEVLPGPPSRDLALAVAEMVSLADPFGRKSGNDC